MEVQSFKVVTLFEFFDESFETLKAIDIAGDGADVELNLFKLGYFIDQTTGLLYKVFEGSQLLIKCNHDSLAWEMLVIFEHD